jgi:signal transduction histidine kinase
MLVNVVKRAEAKKVDITLARDEQCRKIAVQDEEKGFDPSIFERRGKAAGFGILRVQERLTRMRDVCGEVASGPGNNSNDDRARRFGRRWDLGG